MNTYYEPLQDQERFRAMKDALDGGKGPVSVSGCLPSQKAHLFFALTEHIAYRLILAPDEHSARELFEDSRFFDPEVCFYPARDLLFFQADIHGNLLLRQRMQVVRNLLEREKLTVVTSMDGLLDRLAPLEDIARKRIKICQDDTVDLNELRKSLTALGYELTGEVDMPGQFAVRGGILDVYALTEDNPWRIELWGDEVDSIRSFDSSSQRSLNTLEEILIYPASEHVTDSEGNGVCLLDYFPDDLRILADEPLHLLQSARQTEEEFRSSCRRRMEKGQQTFSEDWLHSTDELLEKLNTCPCLAVSLLKPASSGWKFHYSEELFLRSVASYNGSFELLARDLVNYKTLGYRIVLLSGSRTRAQRLAVDLSDEGLNAFYSDNPERILQPGEILVAYGHVHTGFEYPQERFALMTETDIFGRRQQERKKKKKDPGQRIQDFAELVPGDYVIHERHGLGIYRGIEKVEVDQVTKDYIRIEYRDSGSLFIPATQLDMLSKYAGADTESRPVLNRLGSPDWGKTRKKVQTAVRDIAKDLVELYAARQNKEGYVCGPDTVWQREFEEMFPFEETADQLNAIEDTKHDLQSTKIMDRLICGDVGYGKTEIALRAAFKEVQESRQVLYLVPTTILAQQHYNTFVARMKNFPVRVDLLSRFRTPKQQAQTIADLKKGLVDVVIGTHRVLSKDVQYKNLGLLIIDEEQRFGVRHKEKIKQLRRDVDVLTLTATPIPRTLHMSLIGIRDMSLLEEPPMDRIPIQTYVMEYDEETVREAISREMRRGGQVYYVYNRVNDIDNVAMRVQALVPEARVGFAHGQMSERELEKVMIQFVDHELDILVSTTIIETGLDISNVNTMIIHDSDRYGLSQLYQLRGRIGRSNRTAYAFLMYKKDKMLQETAEKRLAAIREYTDLGSGFKIAMRDLELRGAGNLLGAEQHGHMHAVGYDLYCKMLGEAVREAKGQKAAVDFDTSIDLDLDAYIPDSYIPNEHHKLDLYKRIAGITTQQDYEEILDEMLDRFGEAPKSVLNLLSVALIKAVAHGAYVTEIRQIGSNIRIRFFKEAKLNGGGLPGLVARYHRRVQFVVNPEPTLFLRPMGNPLTDLMTLTRDLQTLVE